MNRNIINICCCSLLWRKFLKKRLPEEYCSCWKQKTCCLSNKKAFDLGDQLKDSLSKWLRQCTLTWGKQQCFTVCVWYWDGFWYCMDWRRPFVQNSQTSWRCFGAVHNHLVLQLLDWKKRRVCLSWQNTKWKCHVWILGCLKVELWVHSCTIFLRTIWSISSKIAQPVPFFCWWHSSFDRNWQEFENWPSPKTSSRRAQQNTHLVSPLVNSFVPKNKISNSFKTKQQSSKQFQKVSHFSSWRSWGCCGKWSCNPWLGNLAGWSPDLQWTHPKSCFWWKRKDQSSENFGQQKLGCWTWNDFEYVHHVAEASSGIWQCFVWNGSHQTVTSNWKCPNWSTGNCSWHTETNCQSSCWSWGSCSSTVSSTLWTCGKLLGTQCTVLQKGKQWKSQNPNTGCHCCTKKQKKQKQQKVSEQK